MKCDKCGYSDNGTGDWAHACGPVAIQRAPVMNSRIQELAEQAGLIKVLDEHASEYGGGTFENTPYPELEKFAELIVRECMRMCDCADVSLLEHNRPQEASGASSVKQFIAEHFGVEE